MGWSPNREALRGRVAVVAGATRGAGRGIAAALGEAGATVVCTSRSTRATRSDYNRSETIEETAELVTHLGGSGIAAAVDHLEPDQVKSLGEQIRKDHGHIDMLVNDIWGPSGPFRAASSPRLCANAFTRAAFSQPRLQHR